MDIMAMIAQALSGQQAQQQPFVNPQQISSAPVWSGLMGGSNQLDMQPQTLERPQLPFGVAPVKHSFPRTTEQRAIHMPQNRKFT